MSGTFVVTTQTTRQVSRTDVVGVNSIAFIRPIEIQFTVTDTKPNTRVYAFFDGVSIDRWTRPLTGSNGDPLITDSAGRLTAVFSVPPVTFNTGNRTLRIQDSVIFNPNLDVAGSLVGSASAVFSSHGIRKTLRETITNITEITVTNNVRDNPPPPSPPRDPLAQTIFTYGVRGGCFITKIDIWFQSKDANIPVILELREVENGYPSNRIVSNDARVSLNPDQVQISQDASLATSFVFTRPIYLEEDRDYCFVLMANTNDYHVWTSKLGEKSVENGRTVFEQPFIGTMFKSENNITWSAEQTEDIKFRVWKANFNTNVQATLNYTAPADRILVYGEQFTVQNGSPSVTVDFNHRHALNVDSRIVLEAFPGMNYRGIPAANLTGEFTVSAVLDEFRVTFNAGSAATSTGTLSSAGSVLTIEIDNTGSGYTTVPTISISAPTGAGGTQATAVATINNGRIASVTITDPGTGYEFAPTVTVSGGGGTGAVLTAIVEAIFVVQTNRLAHLVNPMVVNQVLPDTQITSNIRTTNSEYVLGQTRSARMNSITNLEQDTWLVSTANQTAKMFGTNSTEFYITLSSQNNNTSPVINANEQTRLAAFSYVINNQEGETITATNATGSVQRIVVTAGGSGYTTPPTVQIIGNGTGARATASVSGGVITGIVVNSAGTGYTETPMIAFSGGGGSGGAAQAILTPFNTELLPRGGRAFSKYITKPVTLATVSKGIRLFANAFSQRESSFEFYIRTSLSGTGVTHTDLEWRRLQCDVDRNLSVRPGDFRDYTFYLDNIPEFDVYDLKCVLRSSNRAVVPSISNYRVIILAT